MRVAFLLQERFKAYREMLSKSSSSKSSSVEDGEGVCGAIDAFVDEDDDDDENAKVFFGVVEKRSNDDDKRRRKWKSWKILIIVCSLFKL